MTDNDKIIASFLADPPVKPEPNLAAARYSVRRVTDLTQDKLHPLGNPRTA